MRVKGCFILFLVFLLSLSSCVEDLPLDIAGSEVVVVNCILSNDSIQRLSITRSVKVGANYIFKEIRDADISLLKDDVLVGKFARTAYDNWQLKHRPLANSHYQLTVKLPDGKELRASTTMPIRNRIVAIKEKDILPTKNFCQYTADNPCWAFILASQSFTPTLKPREEDKLKSFIGTDHPLIDRFNEDGNLLGLVPNASTPAYNYYARFKSKEEVAEEGIDFCLQTNFGGFSFIFFRTASYEYDQYLKTSLQKMFAYIDEDDPGQWFDESRIYTNIENGVGIFAAYSDSYIYYIE